MLSLLVLAGILPTVLIAIGVIYYDYERERRQLVQSTVLTSRSIITLLDQVFLGVEATLATLSTSPTVWDPDRSRFYDQAQAVLKSQISRNILLTDPQGNILINTLIPYGDPIAEKANPAQIVKLRTTHSAAVSDLFLANNEKQLIVSVAVPVIKKDVHEYNIFARLTTSVFVNLLAEQGLDPAWIVAITDTSGKIVARSRDNDQFIGKKISSDLLNALQLSSEGSLSAKTLDGTPVLAAYSQSGVTGWTVAIGIPVSLLNKDLHTRLVRLILATGAVLAIGLLLSWFIGGRIISATRSLIKPAMLLGDGRMVRIRVVGLKEIDEVGKALALASEKLSTAQYKANHDNLTGLPNRALFYDVLASFMRISSRNKSALSLLFIDLDGFKKINDQFGHATGDELLRLVAARLILIVRASDITARLGGDEFAVALPDTTSEEAEIVANKIVQGLSSPYTVDLQNLQISASIGIAVASIHTLSVESLVRAADDAMYVAKAAGKARVHVGA